MPETGTVVDRQQCIELLSELVAIDSVSRDETRAVRFLVERMAALGLESSVDAAGNAVGVRFANRGGMTAAPRLTVVLLGHIDTVPGHIPVRVEYGRLFGRGSVDAKGPLAAMVLAAAMAELPPDVRLVVAGAVEEETATSRGARQIVRDWKADACVIGEPGGADGIVLGYKGRMLIDLDCAIDEGHTAGPGQNAAELAAGFWQSILQNSGDFNRDRPRLFDQLLPSLREFNSSSDGLISRASLRVGVRLPPEFDVSTYEKSLRTSAAFTGGTSELRIHGIEQAWVTRRDNSVARSLARAMIERGMRPVWKHKTGTADFNVVGPVWNCPMVAYGPGDSSLDHTPRESQDLEEFVSSIGVLKSALEKLTRR